MAHTTVIALAALAPQPLLHRTVRSPVVRFPRHAGSFMEILDNNDGFDVDKAKREYAELSREYRRTVYMHDDWLYHRSSERYWENIKGIFGSGVNKQLYGELTAISFAALFVIVANCLLEGYTDLDGTSHVGPLAYLDSRIGPLTLPSLFFSVALPALSLLLVFQVNTSYSRWNEARTLWGGIINTCRNIVRQGNTFFPDGPEGDKLRDQLTAHTVLFARALRNFLRGPDNDKTFKGELYEQVVAGRLTQVQADTCMASSNRPMYAISAIGAVVRKANLNEFARAQLDESLTKLADLTGANERIFKSPVPILYTRHSTRFLIFFCTLLPFGIWPTESASWNHWMTLPTTFATSYWLLGIDEISTQVEEPFSILPLESFCNGAIDATTAEMMKMNDAGVFITKITPPQTAQQQSVQSTAGASAAPASAAPVSATPVSGAAASKMSEEEAKRAWLARQQTPQWGKKAQAPAQQTASVAPTSVAPSPKLSEEEAKRAWLARQQTPQWGKKAQAPAQQTASVAPTSVAPSPKLSEEEAKRAWLARQQTPQWGTNTQAPAQQAASVAPTPVAQAPKLSEEEAKRAWLARQETPQWGKKAEPVAEVVAPTLVEPAKLSEEEAKRVWLAGRDPSMKGVVTKTGLADRKLDSAPRTLSESTGDGSSSTDDSKEWDTKYRAVMEALAASRSQLSRAASKMPR